MWFVYIEGHGKYEFAHNEQEEMTECVGDYLQTHQADAITVVEGQDITNEVIQEVEKKGV